MKNSLARILALCVMLGIWGTAAADTVRVVWICEVNDGKTLDDVRTANSAWAAFMHENVDAGISSTILTPIIGNTSGGRFIYADDFPSMAVWNASLEASETDEGQAIDAALGEVASCDSSSLYSAEVS